MIAVVDDDPSVRKAIARLLNATGLDVATFASANAYLDAPNVRPDCLVTDIHMPGMSGFDLKSLLAQSEHDVPVIFITASDDAATRARAAALGAAGFHAKPFDGAALLESIGKIVDLGG